MNDSMMLKNEAKHQLQMQIGSMSALIFIVTADEFNDWAAVVKADVYTVLNNLAVEVRRLSQIVFGE